MGMHMHFNRGTSMPSVNTLDTYITDTRTCVINHTIISATRCKRTHYDVILAICFQGTHFGDSHQIFQIQYSIIRNADKMFY